MSRVKLNSKKTEKSVFSITHTGRICRIEMTPDNDDDTRTLIFVS